MVALLLATASGWVATPRPAMLRRSPLYSAASGYSPSHAYSHVQRPTVCVQTARSTGTKMAAPDAIPSALVAYGHYLGFILGSASLAAERVLIKPAMSMEEEKMMTVADAAYGISGLIILVTGYLRVTQYAKGWEFYQHEPIFWVKLTLLAVAGASSFFPTIKIIQRSLEQQKSPDVPIAPMSEKLAARMTSIINAEVCICVINCVWNHCSSRAHVSHVCAASVPNRSC